MRIRSAFTALTLTGAAMFGPGFGVLTTASDAFAVTKISHETATAMFAKAGITWTSSGNCIDRNNPTCTSFEQLNLESAQGAVALKQVSNCALLITGGTETGHASGTYSHWNGYKLDFGKQTCLNKYIKYNFTDIGKRSDGAQLYESVTGNVYADEGNHWDVTYYNCGC
ncbi:hypothetical protein ACGFYZ_37135 [Streptomyces sp. NPDC048330]|uniref:hypothetical protein n=1 Tax=Streptomyces sp. NPDC048330 TaxID=3365533 RepID=UPI00371186B4